MYLFSFSFVSQNILQQKRLKVCILLRDSIVIFVVLVVIVLGVFGVQTGFFRHCVPFNVVQCLSLRARYVQCIRQQKQQEDQYMQLFAILDMFALPALDELR